MIQNQLQNIEQLEAELWDAADNLRANSKLTAGEYCMPVLGVIFLRHATNRYHAALREIEADQAAGKMPKRPLTAADFKKRGALLLPKEAPLLLPAFHLWSRYRARMRIDRRVQSHRIQCYRRFLHAYTFTKYASAKIGAGTI
jgi:type I restriction-modification system DNA methylase subunit